MALGHCFFGGRLGEDFRFCRMVRLTPSLTRFAPTQKLLVPFNAFDGVFGFFFDYSQRKWILDFGF